MNCLISQIQEEINREGPMTFARYMELALYTPGLGYYEQQREIGRHGDFYTSVSVGSVFGELLAFRFAQWLAPASPLSPFRPSGAFEKLQIVEAGAHQGTLAADILRWMQQRRPDLFARLEYCIVEPSPTHRQWQEQTLRAWLPKIKWVKDITQAAQADTSQVIFSNEFLDAMPVHRLAWDAGEKKWTECRVACENSHFKWQHTPPAPELARQLPEIAPELAEVLPEGYIIEHSPAAVSWWKSAAETLSHGKLMTIDYGLTAEEWFRPERSGGTLRTYDHHHAEAALLDNPGESDITAHVNLSAIKAAGRAAGLTMEGLMEQGRFLTQIMAQTESQPGSFEEWTPARTKQFQTLTHPDHLGRAFRVLIQSR